MMAGCLSLLRLFPRQFKTGAAHAAAPSPRRAA
jgi:hypothetical protein